MKPPTPEEMRQVNQAMQKLRATKGDAEGWQLLNKCLEAFPKDAEGCHSTEQVLQALELALEETKA